MSSTDAGQSGGARVSARAQLPIERLLSRSGLIAAAALAAAILFAWAWLLTMWHGGMDAMHVEPWSAAYLLPAFLMWSLMMVAMMLPSAAPTILLHASIDRAAPPQRLWHIAAAALGYVAMWTAFSALAAVAQAALVDAGLVGAMRLSLGDPTIAAALLVAAGLYQLSAAKAACLDQCRSPVQFVMRYRSPGARGAVRLGLAHGLYCLGCCWALMLLLFVGGVMNLAWVAALALIVALEKLASPGWRVTRWIAAACFGAAASLVAAQLY